MAMIQILPFYHYLPFSPRAAGLQGGYEAATSYAIPWAHIPEFFLKNFTGSRETYWGPNPLKLHSEYLGLPVIALAALGAGAARRRRLVLWLAGIGLLFLLVSMGDATPFYRFWWLLPYVKQTRAPGMAFYVVALIVALLGAFGVERVERGEGGKHVTPWLVAAGVIALLAVSGVFGAVAASFANAHEAALGRMLAGAARANQPAVLAGALGSAAALALVAGLVLGATRGKLRPPTLALGLAPVIGLDLWLNATHFWTYSTADKELYRPDPVTDRVRATAPPYRVLDLGVYPTDGVALMAFDVPQLLGHHSFELNSFDEVLDRRNGFKNLGRLPLWDLFAVRYAIVPAQAKNLDSIPGFKRVLSGVTTSAGTVANLLERTAPAPYARVVPAAVKADSERIVPTLIDLRMDYGRLVLLTPDQPINPLPVQEMPPPSPARATVTQWEPGRMTIALDPAPPAPSYVLVAENWYRDWQATVDGAPTQVLRGDYTLITVPVPAGAKAVELAFRSRDYDRGRTVSLISLVLLAALGLGPAALGRLRRNG